MQRLSASLESAPIVWKDGYPYFVHPVTDGVPRLEARCFPPSSTSWGTRRLGRR